MVYCVGVVWRVDILFCWIRSRVRRWLVIATREVESVTFNLPAFVIPVSKINSPPVVWVFISQQLYHGTAEMTERLCKGNEKRGGNGQAEDRPSMSSILKCLVSPKVETASKGSGEKGKSELQTSCFLSMTQHRFRSEAGSWKQRARAKKCRKVPMRCPLIFSG